MVVQHTIWQRMSGTSATKMRKFTLFVLSAAISTLFLGVVSGCGEKTPDSSEMVKELQSENKPQQEMPEKLKGRGMMRGGNQTSGPAKGVSK